MGFGGWEFNGVFGGLGFCVRCCVCVFLLGLLPIHGQVVL